MTFWNARSLLNKIPELVTYVATKRPHVLAITESKISPDIFDGEISLPHYHAQRKDSSSGTRRGGTVLYVSSSIPHRPIPVSPACLNLSLIEVIASELLLPSGRLLIIAVYRNPRAPLNESSVLLQEIWRLRQISPDCLLVGDFNCPNVNWDSGVAPRSFGLDLLRLADACLLRQIIRSPTWRRNGSNPSLLDLCFTRYPDLMRKVKIRDPIGHSDHSMVTVHYGVAAPLPQPKTLPPRPNPHRLDCQLLHHLARGVSWSNTGTPEQQWSSLASMLARLSTTCIPMCSPKIRTQKPYYTRRVKRAIYRRRVAWRRWADGQCWRSLIRLKKEQRRSRRILRCARQQYEWRMAHRAKTAPKILFAHVNRNRKLAHPPITLSRSDGSTTSNPPEVCEIFRSAFSSTYRVDSGAPIPPLRAPVALMSDPIFTTAEVSRALQLLDCNKGAGPDGLYPRLLKELSSYIAAPLAALYNASISSGQVPQQWKEALVQPIPKAKGSCNPTDYRPISLTSVLSKVMEGLIRMRLYDHLLTALSPQQHGFLPRRSCLSNLLEAEEIVTSFLDSGTPVDVLFLDFAKAFDSVNHRFLLAKLSSLGVAPTVVNWIADFLRGRSIRVRVGDSLSTPAPVPSGVPQGSVLGPLLFVLYVEDLSTALHPHALFYADDGKIIGAGNDPSRTQHLLNTVVEWSQAWDLPLNPSKCHHLHVGNGPAPSFHILGTEGRPSPLTTVAQAKDLGMIVDSTFSPSPNVRHSITKARRMLFFVRRSLSQPTPSTFLPLYKAFVRPHLEYAVQASNPFLKKDILALERVQQLAVKMIKGYRHSPYLSSLQQLRLFSLARRRLRGDLIVAYKIRNRLMDLDWNRYFTSPLRPGLRGTTAKMWQQRPHSKRRQCSFAVRVPPHWNKLPEAIVSAPTLTQFKSLLDTNWTKIFPEFPV